MAMRLAFLLLLLSSCGYHRMKDGAPFPFKGDVLRGSDIKRIVSGSDTGQYGPHSPEAAPASLESGLDEPQYAGLFWKKALDMNMRRGAAGKPHLYPSVMKWARAENGHSDVASLEAFVEAEWGTAEGLNVPSHPNGRPDAAAQRAYFATEEGREYARKWRRSDLTHRQ